MTSFQILTQELKNMGVIEHSQENYFSLLFEDDLSARVTFVPMKYLILDFHLENFFWFRGYPRYAVVDALMRLNALGMHGRGFTLSLDNSDIIVLSKSMEIEIGPEMLIEEIGYLYNQAISIREFLSIISGTPLSEVFSVFEQLKAQEER